MTGPDLKWLLKRGVTETIIESELLKLLKSGKPLRLKQGFDPSCRANTDANDNPAQPGDKKHAKRLRHEESSVGQEPKHEETDRRRTQPNERRQQHPNDEWNLVEDVDSIEEVSERSARLDGRGLGGRQKERLVLRRRDRC